MKILIKKAKIINESSPFNGEIKDILIEDRLILNIDNSIEDSEAILIEQDNVHVSLGWTDLKSDFCDPGMEHKETVESGLDAAAFGGYTHIAVLPGTTPVIDGKSQIEYMQRKSDNNVCSLHAIGAMSVGMKGENLSEMYDMHVSGARIFTDDLHPVNSGIMYRSLLYSRNFGGIVMAFSHNAYIAGKGMVNEGMASTKTGLKASPSIAEVIEIERNIRLTEYTEGNIHLTGVSTSEGVKLIREAKKKGLNITADVHSSHLIYNEDAVLGFDTNFKFMPPLRFEEDRKELWKGVKDGTIDCIVSNHRPKDTEEKDIEFDNAEYGCIGLQTTFSSLQIAKEFDLNNVIKTIADNPRLIIGLESISIDKNQPADLTIFNPSKKWTLQKEDICSSTFNTPYVNKELNGYVIGVVNNGKLAIKEK